MASIDDLRNRLKQIREEIEIRLPDIAITLTLSAKALAERNIKEEGFGRSYSTVEYPAFFLKGKELNQKGTKFLENHGVDPTTGAQAKQGKKKRRKKKEDEDPGFYDTLTNWGEFREAQGLQSKFVDLSYSNMMWSNMQPIKVIKEGDLILAPLGATNIEAQNKMNWNRDRYGDFIAKALGDKEREILTEVVTAEVTSILDQYKL